MNKNALGRSLFYFLFLSLSLCSQPPQRPPDLDRDKRGKCSSRTYFEEKTCVEKENTRKKNKDLSLPFFFFFFLRVSVKGKKKSAGFFLSLSLITSNHARYLPCSHFRACVKKSRKGNCIWETRARGRFSLFLSFRFGALGQARLKKTKKKLSLSICFFLSLTSLPQSITLF